VLSIERFNAGTTPDISLTAEPLPSRKLYSATRSNVTRAGSAEKELDVASTENSNIVNKTDFKSMPVQTERLNNTSGIINSRKINIGLLAFKGGSKTSITEATAYRCKKEV
jgi:hypothetical protein